MINKEKALEYLEACNAALEFSGIVQLQDAIKAVEIASEKEEILETIEEALNNSKCWTKITIQGIKTNIIIEKDNTKIKK